MSDQIPSKQATEQPVVFEFQHTDERGNPIIDPRTGKPAFTNLTGANEREVLEKLKDSYLNVTRAYNRARVHKAVPKEPEPERKELSAEEQRQATLDLQDPTKSVAAARKLAGVDDLETEIKKTREEQNNAKALAAQYQFMSRHRDDFYPCKANSEIMWKYINENGLDPRDVENFEVAFNACLGQLAGRPSAAPAVVPPPPPAIPDEHPPTRTVGGGIQPGAASGQRPKARSTNEITKEKIREMQKTPEGRAEFKRRLRDPKFVEQVNALGIRPAGNFF